MAALLADEAAEVAELEASVALWLAPPAFVGTAIASVVTAAAAGVEEEAADESSSSELAAEEAEQVVSDPAWTVTASE